MAKTRFFIHRRFHRLQRSVISPHLDSLVCNTVQALLHVLSRDPNLIVARKARAGSAPVWALGASGEKRSTKKETCCRQSQGQVQGFERHFS